ITEGFLDNVNQKLFEIIPERWNSTYDARKLNITVENLLRMEAGLWGGFWSPPEHWGYDYLQYSLSTPLLYDPGTPYGIPWLAQYSGAGCNALSGIINKTTGMKMSDFAQKYLFDPLGIPAENYYWSEIDNHTVASSGLYMYPQDMAKLGYLMLNNGTWNGTEIISSEYMNAMMTDYPGDAPYGYLTWYDATEAPYFWYASGMYGQCIVIIRELNLVVVITATESTYSLSTIVRDFITDSILD
ncbi:MAG: serine hydrolase domain-containing protein, partial [Promethearchaeota archaeon]